MKDWSEEYEKCRASPYYWATNFLAIGTGRGGKPIKFTTPLSEEEFNKRFHDNMERSARSGHGASESNPNEKIPKR